MARITIRYRKPTWTIWNTVVVYDEAEAANWIASLRSEGYEVQRS